MKLKHLDFLIEQLKANEEEFTILQPANPRNKWVLVGSFGNYKYGYVVFPKFIRLVEFP